jgi:glycerol-3-phosphate dehydrogenase
MSLGSIAVIGGGINGLCIALELARRGWKVDLFERARCLAQTSSASTKLLHGGLRYLEQGHLALVAECLSERARWLREVPQHSHWLPLLLPIYRRQRRPAWQWRIGLGLYDFLAFGQLPGFARWLSAAEVRAIHLDLAHEELQGAWQFWDGQMDERALGQWVLRQAHRCGVRIHEKQPVEAVSPKGWITTAAGDRLSYGWLVNAAGPWAVQLLDRSGIASPVQLDLVRGSHLLVPVPVGCSLPRHGLFVEVPRSQRIAFLLPYQGELLVGTTEETQALQDPIAASASEQAMLRELVSRTLPAWDTSARRQGRFFAGLRPIVRSSSDVSQASREALVKRDGQLISVFGGKWTTARSLASRLADQAPFNGQP